MTRTVVRCGSENCIAPMVREVTDDGEVIGRYCEECFAQKTKVFAALSGKRRELAAAGVDERLQARILQNLADRLMEAGTGEIE